MGGSGRATAKLAHVCAMGVVGFLVAGPDGILGGAASKNLVDYAGTSDDRAIAAAVSGMVNSCGSIGAILQGTYAAKILDLVGWKGLFFALGIIMFIVALVLRPAANVEKSARRR